MKKTITLIVLLCAVPLLFWVGCNNYGPPPSPNRFLVTSFPLGQNAPNVYSIWDTKEHVEFIVFETSKGVTMAKIGDRKK